MGEAAIALAPFPKWRKPRDEWAKKYTDAEIRRALEGQELTADAPLESVATRAVPVLVSRHEEHRHLPREIELCLEPPDGLRE